MEPLAKEPVLTAALSGSAGGSPRADRRRHPRQAVAGVTGRLAFSIEAEVLDISLAGVAVATVSPLRVGKDYVIRLQGHEESFALTGTVRRSILRRTRKTAGGEVQPVYESGIAFKGEAAALGRLRSLIERGAG